MKFKQLKIKSKKRLHKKNRGQTALEYALVVGAVSLVIMVAWNMVGKSVQDSIQNKLLPQITNQIEKGNNYYQK